MSDAGPRIGFASTDDVAELARLRWELYAEQEGDPAETPESYRERFAPFAAEALASDRWRTWVARDADRLVGAMWLQTVPRVPVPGRRAGAIGYLTNAYVMPAHRNVGLGARMLDRVAGWCPDEGYSLLVVWPTERSRPFYRRGGFDRPDEPLVMQLVPDGPIRD